MPTRSNPSPALMIEPLLTGAFSGRGWQGPTLLGSLRGVSATEAATPPARGRRSIWEHTLHAAYWKVAILRALDPQSEHTLPRSPSNWPRIPSPASEAAWRADRRLLASTHKQLLELATSIDPALLHTKHRGRKWTPWQYFCGIAAHDAYHCGQVQLIKRLIRDSASR